MKFELVSQLALGAPERIFAAGFNMPLREEIGLGLAVALTFIGMALNWHLPRQRMSIEEQMKDGKMTEEEASRRIRLFAILAPLTSIFGIVLLIGVLLAFLE